MKWLKKKLKRVNHPKCVETRKKAQKKAIFQNIKGKTNEEIG